MWKQFLRDYFTFTKKERKGVIILLAVIVILNILPLFFPLFVREEFYDHSRFEQEIASLRLDSSKAKYSSEESREFENDLGDWERIEAGKAREFIFDPNKASQEDWAALGVNRKTVNTIQNYLSKGGRFRKPDDIRKIFGLSKKDADRLLPFVRIEDETFAAGSKDIPGNRPSYTARTEYALKAKDIQLVDINAADTLMFATLPGIGNRLANRIVNYRRSLGGFHSAEQVGETYFLSDSTFQKIKPYLVVQTGQVSQININTASIDQLRAHPYIRYHLANAIVQYRSQHGHFSSVAEVNKLMIITDSVFNKIAPYLTLE